MNKTLSRYILEHLPFLRRYARALTGSQELGDEYLRLSLELIIEQPIRVADTTQIRLELFKAFHEIWRVARTDSLAHTDEDPKPFTEARLFRSMSQLPDIERQVLLLIALEEFSYEETSAVLDLSVDEVRRLLTSARKKIALHEPMPVLIIEDEPAIALNIAAIVEETGHRVSGIAATKNQAIQLADKYRPSLILADIQLRDGDDGIDTVQEILRAIDVPIIFVTGYPERLLTGERLEPAFVIAKPFDPELLKMAIGHVLTLPAVLYSE